MIMDLDIAVLKFRVYLWLSIALLGPFVIYFLERIKRWDQKKSYYYYSIFIILMAFLFLFWVFRLVKTQYFWIWLPSIGTLIVGLFALKTYMKAVEKIKKEKSKK